MSRSGNVLDSAATERLLAALKTERIVRKTYRTRNQAKENAKRLCLRHPAGHGQSLPAQKIFIAD